MSQDPRNANRNAGALGGDESFLFWKRLNPLLRKNALTILKLNPPLYELDPDHWEVRKHRGHDSVIVYRNGDLLRCDQDKHDYTQDKPCSHILVVMVHLGMVELPDTRPTVYRKGDQPRNHRVEALAWKAAPLEVPRLLGQLIQTAAPAIRNSPARPKRGRPRAPLDATVYQAVLRCWERQNLRRLEGTMQRHQEHNPRGPVSAATVSRFMASEASTEVLEKLLSLSTWPVRDYESVAHQDGTGLTTQHFGAWFDERGKHLPLMQRENDGEKERQGPRQHEWMFNVILWTYEYTLIAALRTEKGNFGEPQWAPPLLMRARRMLRFKEFGGDKAYSAGYLFHYLESRGIQGQMKFRDGAKGTGVEGPAGPFNRALRWSQVDPKGYSARANRKNNVETGNAALKRICGERLFSRTLVGQRNEVLCMAIAYNLSRLVYFSLDQDQDVDFTGGIERLEAWESLDDLQARFWAEFPAAKRALNKNRRKRH